jgi:hypothetical protein
MRLEFPLYIVMSVARPREGEYTLKSGRVLIGKLLCVAMAHRTQKSRNREAWINWLITNKYKEFFAKKSREGVQMGRIGSRVDYKET